MALIIEVVYPGGERALAIGYPVEGTILVLRFFPRGPEAAYLDEIEVDFTTESPHPVTRVVSGPRRPTVRMRLDLSPEEIELWIDAREQEGWDMREADDGSGEIWVVSHETKSIGLSSEPAPP